MSLTIVLMLALGIGATTAIFSVVHGVLLKPLPFPPDRIVQIWGTWLVPGWTRGSLTAANFWDLRDRNHTFEEFGILSFTSFSMTGMSEPERVRRCGSRPGSSAASALRLSSGVSSSPARICLDEASRLSFSRTGSGRGDLAATPRHWSDADARQPAVHCRRRVPAGSPWLDSARCSCPSSGGRMPIAAVSSGRRFAGSSRA